MEGWENAAHVARGRDLNAMRHGPEAGRAAAFDFAGTDGGDGRTWIGAVSMAPGAFVAPNHHGRHEVAIAITGGNMDIAWGDKMEFTAQLGPGDFAYFAPGVPHQERNPSATDPVDFIALRFDDEHIAVKLG